MDATRCLELHYLRREVMASRDSGRVIIEFSDGVPVTTPTEARQQADGMIAMVNLPLLGPHWFEADRERAGAIITAVLHLDLETLKPRVPQRMANELTERILAQFKGQVMYLTNVRPHSDISKSPHHWASGSNLVELDAGVVIVSSDLVGLMWVEDRP
jgi:hypothetical protein